MTRIKIVQFVTVIALLFCLAVNSAAANEAANTQSQNLRQVFDQRYEAAVNATRAWYADPQNSLKSCPPKFEAEEQILNMGLDSIPFFINLLETELASPHWGSLQKQTTLNLCGQAMVGIPRNRNLLDLSDKDRMAWYVKNWKEIQASQEKWFYMLEWRLVLTVNPNRSVLHKDVLCHLKAEGRLRDALPKVISHIKNGGTKYIPIVDELMEAKVCGDNPTREQILVWWEANKDKITCETTATPAAK